MSAEVVESKPATVTPKQKAFTVYFKETAPFLGESASASVGARGVTAIEPGYRAVDGWKTAGPKDRCDGLLIRYEARIATGSKTESKVCGVPWANIRGEQE